MKNPDSHNRQMMRSAQGLAILAKTRYDTAKHKEA